jgi:phosphoglycolate phosphatase
MPLFDGVEALLHGLHADDRLLAIATGKSRRGLDTALADSGLGALFAASRTADETFSKPHPAMLLELMDQLGASPRETLMIGDTEYDMQMAANAGVDALAVGYGVQPPERLLQHGPRACVMSVAELGRWLQDAAAK